VSGKERYIAGMGKVGEHVKILLDVEKLVTDEDVTKLGAKESA
jgi:chemotaxis signal transduction protein